MLICDICKSQTRVYHHSLSLRESDKDGSWTNTDFLAADLCSKCRLQITDLIKKAIKDSKFSVFEPFGKHHYNKS